MKVKKNTDTPLCCFCKDDLCLSNEFAHLPVGEMSGAIEEVTCPNCGKVQSVSPSILWTAWTNGGD